MLESARFHVIRTLGTGGMGIVYEALDRERNVRVAVKTLKHLTPHALVRFKHEFRSLHDIQHPNLVSLGDLYEEQGVWFYSMELVEGTDFVSYVRGAAARYVDAEAPTRRSISAAEQPRPAMLQPGALSPCGFSETRLTESLRQLAVGLVELHCAGKVHRDIKPPNIKVTDGGRVVLLDFGLVTGVEAADQSTGDAVVGTVVYMAPEQAAGARVGPMADWYSVGVVLYEALTGRLPFEGSPLLRIGAKDRPVPPPPRSLADGIPEDLESLCLQLLDFDPARRPTDEEVLERLGGKATGSISRSSSLQAPVFVGRVREQDLLRAAFEDVRSGRATSLVIRGPSGVGKTVLARHFVASITANVPRAVALASRCYEREAVPYKALDGAMAAFESLLRRLDATDAALLAGPDAALVARLFPVLLRAPVVRRAAAMQRPLAPSLQEVRNRAFVALRGLFERLACFAPTILSIDDFQWADADSSALLTALTRPPNPPVMLLLLTLRDGDPVPAGIPEDAGTIDLGALSSEEGRELVEVLVARVAPALTADADLLVREAEGHPLFLYELVMHAVTRGTAGKMLRLEDTLLARVDGLEPAGRQLLETLAVAGAPVPLVIAAQAAGLRPDEATRLASVLCATCLARSTRTNNYRLELYHDRIRETLNARLDEQTRKELHGRLAQAFENAPPELQDPRALVRHLEVAADDESAARHARHAGELAAEALAFDQAADFYQVALRLGHHQDEERRKLVIGLGDALVNAGRCAEGAEAYLDAVAGADAATRLEYRRRAGEQLLVGGHVERGLDEIRGVLAEVGLALPKTPLRALLSLVWYRALLWLRGLRWKVRDPSQIARYQQQRLEIHKALGLGLSIVDNIRGMLFNARGLLLALRIGDRLHVLRSLGIEAAYRAGSGPRRQREVGKLLGELGRVAEATGDSFLRAWAVGTSGCAAYLMGRYQEAVEKTTTADRLLREQPTALTWELNHIRVFRCYALRAAGRLNELGASLDEYLQDATRRGDRFARTTMARAFNIVWLTPDQPSVARRELEGTTWSPPETGFLHLQHWYFLRAQLELELYEGGSAGARQRWAAQLRGMTKSLLMRIQTVRVEFAWLLGRLALADAQAERGPARQRALRVAVHHARKLERERVGYASACACLLGAGIAACRGSRDPAIGLLRDAARLAERQDMALLAAISRWRQGQLLGGEDGRALVGQAETWMMNEGVKNPARMSNIFAPGFSLPPG